MSNLIRPEEPSQSFPQKPNEEGFQLDCLENPVPVVSEGKRKLLASPKSLREPNTKNTGPLHTHPEDLMQETHLSCPANEANIYDL